MLERLRRLKAQRRAAVDWAPMAAEVSRAKQQRAEAVAAGGQEATVERLEALLFRHDPIGINFGDNTDEYRAEAETIAPRRGEVRSVQDVQRVVHEEFVRWFSVDIAGPPDRYGAIAREIWNLMTVDDV